MPDFHEHKKTVIRATLSGLGFDLIKGLGSYAVIGRRALLGFPTALQPMANAKLDAIIELFSIRL
jgi:hypothetical protein